MLPETRLVECSPIYETEPVDVPARFATCLFLNLIVIVETSLAPRVFSDAIHAFESDFQRVRSGMSNAPRTLDIDIVAFGDLILASPELTLPHPRAHARRFVLQPLADLRPDYRLPGEHSTVSDLLKKLPPSPFVNRLAVAR